MKMKNRIGLRAIATKSPFTAGRCHECAVRLGDLAGSFPNGESISELLAESAELLFEAEKDLRDDAKASPPGEARTP